MTDPIPTLRPTEPIDPPDYPTHAGEPLLRELDATEWNMERLNRVSNGAGCVYQVVRGTGSIDADAVVEALAKLAGRHPLLRARIVRLGEGDSETLAFVAGAVGPELVVAHVEDLEGRWPRLVEADMNAGPSPCWRSPPFRAALVHERGDPEQWMLMVAGPHAFCDGLSLAALTDELLRAVVGEPVGPARMLKTVDGRTSPSSPEPSVADVAPPRWVAPEVEVPSTPGRATEVRTALVSERLDAAATDRLIRAAKERGVTAHGAIGAAVHVAHAARHAAVTGASPFGTYRSGTPVSLRRHLRPPLEAHDVRMAVDVAFVNTTVGEEDSFWSLAERFGQSVHAEISSGDVLRSWDQTPRRDRHQGSVGVPILAISNVGRSSLRERYGDLTIREVAAAMTTHGMFQLNMLFTTFGGSLGGCFYCETPTVSRASLERYAKRVISVLTRVGASSSDLSLREVLTP